MLMTFASERLEGLVFSYARDLNRGLSQALWSSDA